MSKKLFNWKFKDVESFLKEHGFVLNYSNGSHFYYVASKNNIVRNDCVHFHGSSTIKPRTLKSIILQSAIEQKVWLN